MLVTVGVVSTAAKWERFDRAWLQVLRHYRISSFHMKEVAHWKGDLATWDKEKDKQKRQELLVDLVNVIKRNVNKVFVRGVELAAYRSANDTYCMDEGLGGAYTYAQTGCMIAAYRWLQEKKKPNDGAGFYVAHGDAGQGAFRKFAKERIGFEPIIAPVRTTAGEEVSPFSAADLIAYEYRLLYNEASPKQAMPPRESWRGLLQYIRTQLPIEAGVLKPADLEQFCKALDIPRRSSIP